MSPYQSPPRKPSRGGNGIIREYRMTTETEMSLWFEGFGNSA